MTRLVLDGDGFPGFIYKDDKTGAKEEMWCPFTMFNFAVNIGEWYLIMVGELHRRQKSKDYILRGNYKDVSDDALDEGVNLLFDCLIRHKKDGQYKNEFINYVDLKWEE